MNEPKTTDSRIPILSIVIPCRAEDTEMVGLCQRCIDSIRNNVDAKDYLDQVEVILVDDASPVDGLSSLVTEGITNFKLVRMDKRIGIGGARNAGMDASSGRYVHYLDADDYVSNNYLKTLLGHIAEDEKWGKGIQLYLISFMRISKNASGKVVVDQNAMGMTDVAYCPVASWCKVVRRDKCVRHSDMVYLEDIDHNFRQLDAVDDMKNVSVLKDISYLCYDNTRDTAYSRTADFLVANHFTMEQLSTQNILVKNNLTDRAVSDLLRAVAMLYDLRNALKHDNVRRACLSRLNVIWCKILTNNFTH